MGEIINWDACVFVHIFSLSYNLFIGFDDVYYITSSLKKAEREKDLQHKHVWKFICVLWFCQSQLIHRIKERIGSTFIRAITCIRSEIMAPKSGQLLVSEAAGLFRSLSRLLVSPLCDLSIYVGFANFRNFFWKEKPVYFIWQEAARHIKFILLSWRQPFLYFLPHHCSADQKTTHFFLPFLLACCIFNWLCPVSLNSSEWGLSCNWLRFYFE